MKINLNWLKDYLPDFAPESVESLCDKMIDAGFDIESVTDESELYRGFIVGEVLTKEKHPNADKLSLCTVDTGTEVLNIVCGAPNVAQGQKVCVATPGAVIPNGEFEIRKSKIRGELSEGMICSESELNISGNHDGILVLRSDAKTGTGFAEYAGLDNVIIEIGVTPNRGDLLSHFGVAREIAGIYGIDAALPEIIIPKGSTATEELISVEILNKEYCKRFTGRVVKNLNTGESPLWMQKRLTSAGMRPRNLIVDITNYVMLETGQPLHAFDYDKVRGKKIFVKTAKDGDKFTTLDSKERILNGNSLMVCDAEGYTAIAGIMGGEHSEISEGTRNVFLESAYFDPVSVRKNSKSLGLTTDASQRFERGVDIDMVKYASLRATMLLCELAGGEASEDLIDVYPVQFTPLEVAMRIERAGKLLGINFSADEVSKILGRIGIKEKSREGGTMVFSIPEARRADIQREPDLIEELARLYGYSRIESSYSFRTNLMKGRDTDCEKMYGLKSSISSHLIGRGFNEILTIPMTDSSVDNGEHKVRLQNSMTAELNSMRTDLTEGMLRIIAANFNNSGKDLSLRLFEAGKVFEDQGSKFLEREQLIFALSGKSDGLSFYNSGRSFDLTDIKGEAEMLLAKLNIETFALFYYNDNQFGGLRIDVGLNDSIAGNINKADKRILKNFGIESDVYFCRFYLDELLKHTGLPKIYRPVTKFPSVKRDIALVVEKSTNFDILSNVLKESGGKLLRNFELIDIYEGEQVGEGKKSYAFSLDFVSDEKTLTDEETNNALEKILSDLKKKAGATLRS